MKKSIASVLVALGFFLSVFVTSSAMAGNLAIGIIGATANFDTTGYEKEGTGSADGKGADDNETNAGSVDTDVFYGTVFAEYTLGETYGLTLGASYTPASAKLGAKTRSDTVSAAKETSTDTGTYKAEAEVAGHTTIYVEPTFMANDNIGVYVKGIVARVKVNSLESIEIGTDSSAYGDETIGGLGYGVGFKGLYDSGLMFKMELIHIDYGTVKMTSTTGNLNTITADPEQTAFRIGIGYQF